MSSANYYTIDGQMVGYQDGGRKDFLTDALGSVTGEIDQTGTNRTFTGRYKPYGTALSSTGSSGFFKWIGVWGYKVTSLANSKQYVRARHYAGTSGAWETVDRFWPNERAYCYAVGNPIVHIDPSGQGVVVLIIGGIIVITIVTICALHGANAGCTEPNADQWKEFNRCYAQLGGHNFDDLLKFKPTLICNDLEEKTDAGADANGLGGGCRFRVDWEWFMKRGPEERCQTLVHEALHCRCKLFYGEDDPRHDTLNDWADFLEEITRRGMYLRWSLDAVCQEIVKQHSPPPLPPVKHKKKSKI